VAHPRNDAGPRAAPTLFCSIFGAVAGDLALAHGARGGVYIAGGIAEKIEEFLIQSPFRRRCLARSRPTNCASTCPLDGRLLCASPGRRESRHLSTMRR
jgi:glucokinase